ncbi:hypothetical protein GQ53DRAFT_835212 [Thozetella sp. PMI_491]|nr:hypothetical protein GQ53DRAFT_835212 [Thozetella sp. PMI_491]
MHPAEEILNQPWPENQGSQPPQDSDDVHAEEADNIDESGKVFGRAENATRRRDLLEQKKGACPVLTLSLRANDTQVYEDSCISFKAVLHYERVPVGDNIPIVAKVLGGSDGPLGDTAVEFGQYQIFTQSDCSAASRIPYSTKYITFRRARGPDGRFLPLPDQTEEVLEAHGWSEMLVGDSITREFTYNLESNQSWKGNLKRGMTYWLAYAPPGKMPLQRSELSSWRYGSMESWRGKKVDLGDERWIGIPIKMSNPIQFTF